MYRMLLHHKFLARDRGTDHLQVATPVTTKKKMVAIASDGLMMTNAAITATKTPASPTNAMPAPTTYTAN